MLLSFTKYFSILFAKVIIAKQPTRRGKKECKAGDMQLDNHFFFLKRKYMYKSYDTCSINEFGIFEHKNM